MNKEQRFAQPDGPAPNDPSPDRPGICARCERMNADDARDVEMLRELAELGMDMARAVQGQVMEQIAAGKQVSANNILGGGDPGLVFSRIAKTVRQAIALKRRIAEEADARQHRTAAEAASRLAEQAQRAASAERNKVIDRRERVQRNVERIFSRAIEDYDYDHLLGDLEDRLDEYEEEGALTRGTIDEIVARMCRDLGITADMLDPDAESALIKALAGAGNDAAGPEAEPAGRARPPGAARNGHDPP